MSTGIFIAFEGGDGVGKTTQITLLAGWLEDCGLNVRVTREPGGTWLGEELRTLLLHAEEELSHRAEALLFAADRAEHVDKVIKPALDAGSVVITDRYVDSSIAYQGDARGNELGPIKDISRWATQGLRPDLTILLDLDPAEGLARRTTDELRDAVRDKMEAERAEFHHTVRMAFLRVADEDPDRYLVLDSRRPVPQVHGGVVDRVAELLRERDLPVAAPAS